MRRFLIDNQLPAGLESWFSAKGCVARHVLTLQMAQSSDEVIWLEAGRAGEAIVTKDEDFARMTVLRPEKVTVLWLRMGNCRTKSLLATMERVWPEICRQLDQGARLIEIH